MTTVRVTVPPTRPDGGFTLLPGIRAFGSVVLIGSLLTASAALLVATERPTLALLPLLLGLVGVISIWLPLRLPLYAAIGTALVADLMYPNGMARDHLYFRGVQFLSWLLLDNLNKLTGIEALRVSGMELVIVLLLGAVALRALIVPASPDVTRMPRPLVVALVISLGVVVFAEVWGIARHGDVRQSLWQFRYVGWLPLLTLAGVHLLRRDEVLPELGMLLTGVGLVKAALALFVYFWSTRHGYGRPHSATSHADTVIFSLVFALWAAQLTFRPATGRILIGLAVMSAMFVAIIANNRRTAFVTLPVMMLLLFLQLTAVRRRQIVVALLALTPLIAAYLMLGRHRTSGIFVPAQMVWSVTKQEDSSSDSREVENANLGLTLRRHLAFGAGFGHPYEVAGSVYDLSEVFAQYRFVAHNSVLWLFSIAGPIGATLLWLPQVVAFFIAARAARLATVPFDKVAAFMVMATITAYLLQAWADMGTQGWTGTTLLSLAFVTTGLVARRTGALPDNLPLVRLRRAQAQEEWYAG